MFRASGVILFSLSMMSGMTALAEDAPHRAAYVPGLGEFMMATQARHAKLWFAGSSGNWRLAAYELDELKEGLQDAGRLYPTLHDWRIPAMVEQNIGKPIAEIEGAIENKHRARFKAAFDRLTAGCNTCHAGTGHDFIQIQRPLHRPASNQAYAPRQ